MLGLFALLLGGFCSSLATPLDDYVNTPDPTYGYSVLSNSKGPGYTQYTLNMTSQTWGKGYVKNHTLWWHIMVVFVPDNIIYSDTAYVMIDGGSNKHSTDILDFLMPVGMYAVTTGMVCADVGMVPNEPLHFHDDPSGKSWSETGLIAWTINSFLREDQDPMKLIHFPVTKASVRGMDTVADLAQKKHGLAITKFIITGASKRGWAAWLTAAVDKRVILLSPIVFDLLNISTSLHHMYRAHGGWTFAFKDFYNLNFTDYLDSQEEKQLETIIDPIAYKDRLTMPKYIISSCGDEYFMLDNSHYYFDQLEGEKYLKKNPNTDHILVGHILDILFAQRAFILTVLENKKLPQLSWTVQKDANSTTLTVTCDPGYSDITVYYAQTLQGNLPNRRDYRLMIANPDDPAHETMVHPVGWYKTPPQQIGANQFRARFYKEGDGWTGFFMQVSYPSVRGSVLELTSDVEFAPDTFPYPECRGIQCKGNLV